jgi:hypothetical protein
MNGNSTACSFGTLLGVVAFLASMGFLVGEYFFEQMSSVKTRKHFVMGDMAFSGKWSMQHFRIVFNVCFLALWAFLYFVGFCYLTNQWGKSEDPPNGYGVNNIQASIAFSFFSIFTWAGCAYFAYLRFKAGKILMHFLTVFECNEDVLHFRRRSVVPVDFRCGRPQR